MNIVFMGTPEFAVPTLKTLASQLGYTVSAVYTKVDTTSRRGKKLQPSPVKIAAEELDLPVFQPTTLRDAQEILRLEDLRPDVIVVAAYGLILPPAVLAIPRFGCINVHGSLLPRWRGAAPIERAILADDVGVGVSIMQMEEGLDTGPYARTATVRVEDHDATSLREHLAVVGAGLLLLTLRDIEKGSVTWTPQDESQTTYAKKITKEDVALSPDLSAKENILRVRASSDSAPARLCLGEKPLRVLQARISSAALKPGEVLVTKSEVALGTQDGAFVLLTVRPEGKGAMEAASYIRGIHEPLTSWGRII